MNTKLSKESIAIIVFALFEMLALRAISGTVLQASGAAHALPSDGAFAAVALLLGASVGVLLGWLIFKKWAAKFSVRAAVAAGVVVVSFTLTYWMSMIMLRSMMSGVMFN